MCSSNGQSRIARSFGYTKHGVILQKINEIYVKYKSLNKDQDVTKIYKHPEHRWNNCDRS
jgi:hypothetical protein